MKVKDYIRQLNDEELVNFLMEFDRRKIIDIPWCSKKCPHRIRVNQEYSKCNIDLEKQGCPYENDSEVLKVWLEEEVGPDGLELEGLSYVNYD